MIEVDLRSRVPLYEQIIENIKGLILSGKLKPDEKLVSVRELASKLTINPNTIQRSFRKLEEEGYIYSVRGRGNFVMVIDEKILESQKVKAIKAINESLVEAKMLNVSKDEVQKAIEHIFGEGVSI